MRKKYKALDNSGSTKWLIFMIKLSFAIIFLMSAVGVAVNISRWIVTNKALAEIFDATFLIGSSLIFLIYGTWAIVQGYQACDFFNSGDQEARPVVQGYRARGFFLGLGLVF